MHYPAQHVQPVTSTARTLSLQLSRNAGAGLPLQFRCLRRGAAHDQPRLNDVLPFFFGLVYRLVPAPEKTPERSRRKLPARNVQSRQRGLRVSAEFDIVETDDGNIFGDAQTRFMN